jgi:hypothetical protein
MLAAVAESMSTGNRDMRGQGCTDERSYGAIMVALVKVKVAAVEGIALNYHLACSVTLTV